MYDLLPFQGKIVFATVQQYNDYTFDACLFVVPNCVVDLH